MQAHEQTHKAFERKARKSMFLNFSEANWTHHAASECLTLSAEVPPNTKQPVVDRNSAFLT